MSHKRIGTHCPLCDAKGRTLSEFDGRRYYSCPTCQAVYMDPEDYLSAADEKERYEEHNNDVHDPGYQKFVAPIVDAVLRDYGPEDIGLDYGCGTGPVITKLLRDAGYQINLYDPFFADYQKNLDLNYDYIVCCEVAEHFHYPAKEFRKLYSLMKPGRSLYVKTVLYSDDIDFDSWYYKNDPTHVFFYSEETLEWIRKHFGFFELHIEENHIEFTVAHLD